MSQYERNRGKLIPVKGDLEDLAEELIKEVDDFYKTKLDEFISDPSEFGYQLISGKYYKLEDHVKDGEMDDYANVTVNDDGSLEFDTYHYNGGGHWTEMVESGLRITNKLEG